MPNKTIQLVIPKNNNQVNLDNLNAELNWFGSFIKTRISEVKSDSNKVSELNIINFPELESEGSEYAQFIEKNNINEPGRLIILLCLALSIKPWILKGLVIQDNPFEVLQFPNSNNIIPTMETILQLLAGNNSDRRTQYYHLFDAEHPLVKKRVIEFGDCPEFGSPYHREVKISNSYQDLFVRNQYTRPRFSNEFPAELLETELEWEDVMLPKETFAKLEEIKAYLEFQQEEGFEPFFGKHIRPGYRCLFYGPSGTGKTLVASLLGKYMDKDVYRVDLSRIISKYIGETSKNLQRVFDYAEDKDWILFFDEGDAIFGKRVDTSKTDNMNSTHANQDVAYLLQRIERYNGLIIVASNLKNNMDDAFGRRFEGAIHFNLPTAEEAAEIWAKFMPKDLPITGKIQWSDVLTNHPLSTASIVNVIARLTRLAKMNKQTKIMSEDIIRCIKDESYK
ncbi:MAG: ATP-binding protein [Flavobacteriales bacterium]|nr:ATP-binding protein [Flavobacteriales bacterium]